MHPHVFMQAGTFTFVLTYIHCLTMLQQCGHSHTTFISEAARQTYLNLAQEVCVLWQNDFTKCMKWGFVNYAASGSVLTKAQGKVCII